MQSNTINTIARTLSTADFKKKLLVAAFSGALMGLSWPPAGLWIGALFAPGLWAICLIGLSLRDRFVGSLLFFTSAWSVAFSWNASHPVATTATSSVIALFCMITLLSAIASGLSRIHKKDQWTPTACWFFVGIYIWDFIMMNGPLAMPGTMLGLAVSDSILATIWVPLVGSLGLTALVLSINLAWITTWASPQRRWLKLGSALIVVVLPAFFQSELPADNQVLRVVQIQPGMAPEEWAEVDNLAKIDTLTGLLRNALRQSPETDVFLLPETALPILDKSALTQVLTAWSDSLQTSILTGGILEENGSFFNIAATQMNKETWIYRKRRLIPFVESVPFGDHLPFADQFQLSSGGVSAYQAGNEMGITTIAGIKVGILICFESFFPSDAVTLKQNGAELIVVITQDGWWRSDQAKQQHASYTRLIALAAGIPAIQTSVDGVTAAWDAVGDEIGRIHSNQQSFLHSSIPIHRRSTPYSILGDLGVAAIVFILAGLLFIKSPPRHL